MGFGLVSIRVRVTGYWVGLRIRTRFSVGISVSIRAIARVRVSD